MAIFAIGDVQGCFDELIALVEKISFDPAADQLWFVGDIVNRGPCSLETLRWIKELGDAAITVLGNHDLYLLAAHAGIKNIEPSRSFHPILQANDVDELIHWLRHRPLMHYDASLNTAMVHAGLLPQWKIYQSLSLANEVENVLRADNYIDFMDNMYGDTPNLWDASLTGWSRLRIITNSFTRLRYCTEEGVMNFSHKGPPGTQPPKMRPWYEISARNSQDTTVVFGHWSTLGYKNKHNVIATDTGCLWGGNLTAVRVDHTKKTVFQIDCEAKMWNI